MNENIKITDPNQSPIETAQDLMKRVQFVQMADGPSVFTYIAIGRVADAEMQAQYEAKWAENFKELWPALTDYFIQRTGIPLASGQPVVDVAMTAGAAKGSMLARQLMAGEHPLSPKTMTEAGGDWNEGNTKMFLAIMANTKLRGVFFGIYIGRVPIDKDGFMDIKFHEMEQHQLP